MKIRHINPLSITLLSAVLAAAPVATAETVLLNEDFNDDYTKSFLFLYDADRQTPHGSIASLFYSQATGATMPWWICKDSSHSTDKFMASHSYYAEPGQSNDWLISIPMEIPTEGFVLEFDAQCVRVRDMEHISDLSLFIMDELLDVTNIPTEPTHVFESVPYGADPDNCEGDWTHYTYSLDKYAGQTVYVNFVNLNEDRDILCIDNVKVARQDPAEFTLADYDAYTLDAQSELRATVTCMSDNGLKDVKVLVFVDGKIDSEIPVADLRQGESATVSCPINVSAGQIADFRLELIAANMVPLAHEGSIGRLAFEPTHRVFFEETTSLYCGNCPMGMYVVESMLSDAALADRIVPVGVHIASMGFDPMATSGYYLHLPMSTAAPLVYVERSQEYDGFIPAYDMEYDRTNPKSFAYRIDSIANVMTLMDIAVNADWVIEGTDTVAVQCTATVKPAVNIAGKEYRVAFVLTENNVGIDNNPYWMQSNYLSGADYKSRAGGWCDLGDNVLNARYHDVARAISEYGGHEGSLPSDMKAQEEYTFSYTLSIPDTKAHDLNGFLTSERIRTEMCELSAVLIDAETGRAVNAVRVPLSERATKRFTVQDLVNIVGITDITGDADSGVPQYYDITGRRLAAPAKGIVIRRTATGATKEAIR